jgi:hypothetical protein
LITAGGRGLRSISLSRCSSRPQRSQLLVAIAQLGLESRRVSSQLIALQADRIEARSQELRIAVNASISAASARWRSSASRRARMI